MPISSFDHPGIGYAAFCAVKLAGYSVAAAAMSRTFGKRRNPILVGATRTLIGMAVGGGYYLYFSNFVAKNAPGSQPLAAYYIAGLVALRLVEWWALIAIFFDSQLQTPKLDWKVVFIATVWSFVLDPPATLGFCITGGVNVC